MYLTLLFLPLIAGILANNRFTGYKFGPLLSILSLLISLIFSILILLEIIIADTLTQLNLCIWLNSNSKISSWNFNYNNLNILKIILILLISVLIQLYSLDYMRDDPNKGKFFSYLLFFSFKMLVFVSSNDLLIKFLGWEGIGLLSYLLVNFWQTRIKANLSSLSAIFKNKIGDLSFLLLLILVFNISGYTNLSLLFSITSYLATNLLNILAILVIITSSAKSALTGIHIWLPKAKEGPTPVSALLHSSTMVTAGCFLLIKFSPLLSYSSQGLNIILLLGSLNILIGSIMGVVDNDIKRVVAFSTKSQLGYKCIAIGKSYYSLALYHLLIHAFFKSLLFLASGVIKHSLNEQQDIRKMGTLLALMPLTYTIFILGSLSLIAFPFSSGFYSKDLLIELLLVPNSFNSSITYLFAITGALYTTLYSVKLGLKIFFMSPSFYLSSLTYIKFNSNSTLLIIIILASLSIVSGFLLKSFFLIPEHLIKESDLLINLFNYPKSMDKINIISYLTLLPLGFLLLFISFWPIRTLKLPQNLSYKKFKVIPHFIYPIFYFTQNFNIIYTNIMNKGLSLANVSERYLDKGYLYLLGPTGCYSFLMYSSLLIETLSSRNLLKYLLPFIMIMVIVFLGFDLIFIKNKILF